MAKKKNDNIIIKLVDKEPNEDGTACTPSVYWTTKNKKTHTTKMSLMKYNKHKKKHTLHTEAKS